MRHLNVPVPDQASLKVTVFTLTNTNKQIVNTGQTDWEAQLLLADASGLAQSNQICCVGYYHMLLEVSGPE